MILTCIIASVGLSVAQTTTKVSGTIVDDTGETVIGASVVAKGTTVGTVTDVDGKFSLNIPSDKKTLVISLIGLRTKEVAAGQNLRIVLENDSKLMDEVVVTAMGMTKSQKTLGYAASTIKQDEITVAQSGSLMSGLMGKVAGMNISSAGATGTSQKVIVRGLSSFTSNQPLYIIDGSPVQNTFSGVETTNNSVDFGNSAGDINPDDVESVTVLKGASATALYGSRAANGVIMITTKKAAKNSKPTLTYSGSFSASDVLRTPKTQDMFGEGWPFWDAMENGSWGPKLDGRTHIWGAGITDPTTGETVYREKPYSYVKNNARNFYETGLEMNNNVTFSTSGEHTGIVASYGNLTSDGIIPGDVDKYVRNTFSLRGRSVFDKLSVDFSLNYARKDISAVSAGQGSDGAALFQEILQTPVDINLNDLKDLNNPYNNVDNYYTPYAENPYWVAKNNGNKYVDNHTYGNINLSYQFLPWLKGTGRVGGDFIDSRRKSWSAIAKYSEGSYSESASKNEVVGSYREFNESRGQLDVLGMLDASYDISKDINLSGFIGWNYNHRDYYYSDAYLSGLNVPGWYSLENGNDKPVTTSREYKRRLYGLLGQAEVGFKNYWFTTLSLRNDWSSTLPKNERSFFYWGLNSTLLLTDMLPELKNDILSFLKIRAAYGKTGNDADWYLTKNTYQPTNVSLGFGDLDLPLNGVPGLTIGNTKGNSSLKPEITREIEFGFDARFFDNRVSIDFSYYDRNTRDQIIASAVPYETGYSLFTRNVGEIQNRGIELAVGLVPVKTKDWEWSFNTTFSKNTNKVKKLWSVDGVPVNRYVITSAYGVDYVASVGQALGSFEVPTPVLHDGKVVVNSNGLPLIDSSKKEHVGNSNPNFVMGFTNRVKWKNISLGVVFDWRSGGKFWSNTAEMLTWNGNATSTTFNERQPFVIPNSVKQVTVDGQTSYVENDIPLTWATTYAYYGHSTNQAQYKDFVISRSYLKLRELTLSYSLPKEILRGTFFKEVELTAIGRNLLMWTPKENNFVDPEATNYGNDIKSEFGEFTAAPTTRSFGGSIKVTF